MHSSFASESIRSLQESVQPSTSSNHQSETTLENKSLSEYSSQTLTPSSYTSIVSSESQTKNSKSNSQTEVEELDNLEQQPENKQTDTAMKDKSPSESSISEIISVIANSKNGERNSVDLAADNGSPSIFKSKEEKQLSDVSEIVSDVPEKNKILKSPEGSITEDLEGSFHEDDGPKQDVFSSRESSPASAVSEV